ncbi:hypothetical protein BDR22DRAFT_838227 [Usnea florida]
MSHDKHAPIYHYNNNKNATLVEEAVRAQFNHSALTARDDLPFPQHLHSTASIPIKKRIPALPSKPWRGLAPLFLVGEGEVVGFFEVFVVFGGAVPEGVLAVPLTVPFEGPAEPETVVEGEVEGLEAGVVVVDVGAVGVPDVSCIGPPVDIMIGVASEAVAVPAIVNVSSLIWL